MNNIFLTRLLRMLLLVALQVLVFNHIHVAGYVTPIMVGYVVLACHRHSGRIELLLWGFVTGLLFDVFSNTPGLCATAMTLTAMLQPSVLSINIPNDAAEGLKPSIREMGLASFTVYSATLMSILHCTFYLLDAFTLYNWQLTLVAMVGGTLLSTLLCVVMQAVVNKSPQS